MSATLDLVRAVIMRAMRSRGVFAILVMAVSLMACNTGRGALVFSPDRLQNGAVGQPYEAVITISNNETPVGDMYVSNGALPPGMTLNFSRGSSSSADLTGTPATAGTYVFTVSAWCLGTNVSGQSGEQSYSLVVT
jgi:large repetitive protein